MNTVLNWFKDHFTLDLRSLALFRISAGLAILADLYLRIGNISKFYTDEGIVPREAVGEPLQIIYPHFFSGSYEFQLYLFALAALLAIMLIVGFKTKLATITSWFLFNSLIVRDPFISHGGEVTLRMFLLFAIFLPLGEYFSIDAKLKKTATKATHIFNLATVAVILQFFTIYFCASIYKVFSKPWIEGNGVLFALSADQWATSLGAFMLTIPGFAITAGYGTVIFEMFAPILFVITSSLRRTLIIFVFICFHLGLYATMTLSAFPLMSISALLILLPSYFWDQIYKFLKLKPVKSLAYEKRLNIISKVLIILILIGILFVTLIGFKLINNVPSKFLAFNSIIGQRWNLFVDPGGNDTWPVIPSTLANGTVIDAYTGKKVDYKKPKILSGFTRNGFYEDQIAVMFFHKAFTIARRLQPYYAEYVCREWNKNHSNGERMVSLKIIHVQERYPSKKIDRRIVNSYKCN